MTFGNVLSQMGVGKQASERFAEYHSGPPNEQFLHYGYEAPAVAQNPMASSKHNHGGGHKSNAAMSALTLLAFLFFLNILQQCLKDHMNSMTTPQFMVMTAGREGEEPLQKSQEKVKIDKSGVAKNTKRNEVNQTLVKKNEKVLTKIPISHHVPKNNGNYRNSSLNFPGFVSAMYDDEKYRYDHK